MILSFEKNDAPFGNFPVAGSTEPWLQYCSACDWCVECLVGEL